MGCGRAGRAPEGRAEGPRAAPPPRGGRERAEQARGIERRRRGDAHERALGIVLEGDEAFFLPTLHGDEHLGRQRDGADEPLRGLALEHEITGLGVERGQSTVVQAAEHVATRDHGRAPDDELGRLVLPPPPACGEKPQRRSPVSASSARTWPCCPSTSRAATYTLPSATAGGESTRPIASAVHTTAPLAISLP